MGQVASIHNPTRQTFLPVAGSLANLLLLLYSSVLLEVSMIAAHVAENRKHTNNDRKCEEMGWVCIPFVVEYWGAAAVMAFSKLTGTTPLTIIYR